jgi:putative colanic acid biosynthesis UDP-glucose lipid carrier transferase
MEAAELRNELDDVVGLDDVIVHGHVLEVRYAEHEHRARSLTPTLTGGPSGAGAVAKRFVDVLVALVALVLVLPVMVVAAVGVKLSSPGPILFRQHRLTRNGDVFTMLKFRTFPVEHVDATVSLPTTACPLPWGRLLRRTSIDELPQLLNVLLGHMSLVGPRPERPRFAEELADEVPGYVERLRAPAGITGLAQIRGLHGTSSLQDRIDADNEYIERWSFWSDLRILFATVPTVVRKAR